jgi:acetyl-CoA acyltransferase 2
MMGHQGRKVFILGGKRTPFGKFGGSLSNLKPVELALIAARSLVTELRISPDLLSQVIFANVIPSTPDTLYAGRHLGLKLGMNPSTTGVVVNRLCGSGIQGIIDAKRIIASGEAEAILVAGAENMSMTPHLTYGARFGTKYGVLKSQDLLLDTLTDTHVQLPMGITAENLAEQYAISRDQSDQYSFDSHAKANLAYRNGLIQPELAEVSIDRVHCSKDEHLREDISLEDMKKLKSTFKKDAVVTPGSASGIVDGACATIVASEDFILKNKLSPLAEILSWEVVGVDPALMGIGPVPAINKMLEKNKMQVSDIDLFEINEAFAPQVIACQKALSIDANKLNLWGGAIALGHPLGASGIKITLTLARQLKHFNKKIGVAAACIGGGQGISILIKSV